MSADLLPYGLGDDDEDIDTVVGPHPTELAHVAGMAPKQPNAAIAPAQPTPDGPNAAAAQARVTQLEHVLSKANEELAL